MIRLAIPLLHVSDHDTAQSFYCDCLGFTKTSDYRPFGDNGPCYFGLSRDGIRFHVSSFPEDGKSGNAIVLVVDNIDDLYKEFSQKKIKIDLEPTDQSWGNRE